ncbi:MAG: siphovirus ReqiPepy6 Gp37-like family protein, partial [Candidatus Bathyarchaeota archaeon]|nr:siphovirus ReqiPepy6 Gp37-like family protein [Candidatus Termiticorpusculum sp.]
MPNIEAFVFTASGGIEIGNAAIRLETNTEGPVGEWKLTLNNTTDASQLLKAGQYIILGADQHTLMKGYVEDILPEVTDEKSVFYKTVTVKGLNAGRDLLKHLIHANFVNPKLGDLMDVTLKATGSNIRVFPNLIGQGPVIKNCKAKDTYVIDLFNEAGQEAGYWWLYNWDDNYIYAGPLQNTLHTNITLTSIA